MDDGFYQTNGADGIPYVQKGYQKVKSQVHFGTTLILARYICTTELRGQLLAV